MTKLDIKGATFTNKNRQKSITFDVYKNNIFKKEKLFLLQKKRKNRNIRNVGKWPKLTGLEHFHFSRIHVRHYLDFV